MDKLKILFEDDSLLVLDKPPGLVVDKSETQQGSTLEDWLKQNYDTLEYHSKNLPVRMGIVHRLDKDTSGVILVAKTPQALENLQNQFQERKVKKQYLALVHGEVKEKGRVEGAIGRNPKNREKFIILDEEKSRGVVSDTPPKWSVTEYEPINSFQLSAISLQTIFSDLNKIQTRKLERMHYNQFTLLRCYPQTGRTHQIRVHLKYIGHPLVSDEKYVGRKMTRLDKRWCPRQFLHAKKIGFYHPVSGKWMEIESELPEDLEKALGKLKS